MLYINLHFLGTKENHFNQILSPPPPHISLLQRIKIVYDKDYAISLPFVPPHWLYLLSYPVEGWQGASFHWQWLPPGYREVVPQILPTHLKYKVEIHALYYLVETKVNCTRKCIQCKIWSRYLKTSLLTPSLIEYYISMEG